MVYWLLIEVSLIFFLPFILNRKYGFERGIKYFLIQIINSFMLIIRFLLRFKGFLFFFFFLIYKIGRAPFYQWVIYIVKKIDWISIFYLLSVVKFIPIILLIILYLRNESIRFYIILNCIVGCLGGIGQICLRSLISYSSINHLRWFLSCIFISSFIWIKYFIIYLSIFLNLVIFLFIKNIVFLSQIINFNYFYFIIIILLLTLRGLPPFFIFLMKFLILNFLLKIRFFFFFLFLIISSFISLFYYIRFSIYIFMYLNFKKFDLMKNMRFLIWIRVLLNSFGFFFFII